MKDWSLKYRPQRLADLRGQEVNKQILMSMVEKDNLFGDVGLQRKDIASGTRIIAKCDANYKKMKKVAHLRFVSRFSIKKEKIEKSSNGNL